MEKCPYHDVDPEVSRFAARDEILKTFIDGDGALRKYRLPKITVCNVYCPVCRSEQRTAGKFPTKFGKGYAADDEETAVRRWNSSCMSEKLRLFKNAVTGKDE